MTENRLSYMGPLASAHNRPKKTLRTIAKKLPWGFIIVVGIPTLLAAIYFFLIASPRYVSEARFIVRSPAQPQMSALGVALQGAGFTTQASDAFAIHEYITSRDGLAELDRRIDVAGMLAPPNADIVARYPNLLERRSFESMYKAFPRFVTVGYASQTGISTLRVEAFKPEDAQKMADALLSEGEALVNRLNERAMTNTLADAVARSKEATRAAGETQAALAAFRNDRRFLDPTREANAMSQVIVGLMANLAEAEVQRDQLRNEAPQSPMLPSLDRRIVTIERQIAEERSKIAGGTSSLAPQVGRYETLVLQNELAAKEVAAASANLTSARQDAQRQQLYLLRIAAPNLPDVASEPRRLRSILTVLMTCLLIYGVGWLVWAGVREHRQD
ncbi:chain-length determining protein [Brevundimonas sp. P7753]|uniref:chain-length determining protein n=1 Tax=Brevundimonas sp. P7753 TaxID=2726982 RepID=UPI0015C135AF|nr:chain-length determining protein [Brevundimonas sp. P7753]NWE51250.1 chain-length determining protein [Brevundimonas sp. P7753]